MTFDKIVTLVSVLIALVSVIFAIKNSKRNDVKDIEKRASENAIINVKLDTIQNNITDIKYDVSATKQDVSKLSERMIKVEESTKSAHKRLDEYEKGRKNE